MRDMGIFSNRSNQRPLRGISIADLQSTSPKIEELPSNNQGGGGGKKDNTNKQKIFDLVKKILNMKDQIFENKCEELIGITIYELESLTYMMENMTKEGLYKMPLFSKVSDKVFGYIKSNTKLIMKKKRKPTTMKKKKKRKPTTMKKKPTTMKKERTSTTMKKKRTSTTMKNKFATRNKIK